MELSGDRVQWNMVLVCWMGINAMDEGTKNNTITTQQNSSTIDKKLFFDNYSDIVTHMATPATHAYFRKPRTHVDSSRNNQWTLLRLMSSPVSCSLRE